MSCYTVELVGRSIGLSFHTNEGKRANQLIVDWLHAHKASFACGPNCPISQYHESDGFRLCGAILPSGRSLHYAIFEMPGGDQQQARAAQRVLGHDLHIELIVRSEKSSSVIIPHTAKAETFESQLTEWLKKELV